MIHTAGFRVAGKGLHPVLFPPCVGTWGAPDARVFPPPPVQLPPSLWSQQAPAVAMPVPAATEQPGGGTWEDSGICCQCQYFYKKIELFYLNCGIHFSEGKHGKNYISLQIKI